jgi:hypothetical protein
MRSIVVCLAMAIALAACDSTRSLSTADRAALTQHEAQWGARTFHSYSFDYSQSSGGRSFAVHIEVQDDTVASVTEISTGQPPDTPMTWPTVDALYNEADAAVQDNDFTVNLSYDDQYGYPTLLTINSNNAGSEFVARVSNLQPTP